MIDDGEKENRSQVATRGSWAGPMSDQVNHPDHYGGEDNPYEVIKFIEAHGLGFSLGNVVKYVARADRKGTPDEDLEKARWYLDREIAARKAWSGEAAMNLQRQRDAMLLLVCEWYGYASDGLDTVASASLGNLRECIRFVDAVDDYDTEPKLGHLASMLDGPLPAEIQAVLESAKEEDGDQPPTTVADCTECPV